MDYRAPLLFFLVFLIDNIASQDKTQSDLWGQSTTELLTLRGFGFQIHAVRSRGYLLNLIRMVNPKMKGPTRGPILLIHGLRVNANHWLLNSIDARPRDWSGLDVERLSLSKLISLLAKKPESRSLAILLCNLGFDVWLLNRKPTAETLKFNGISPETIHGKDIDFKTLGKKEASQTKQEVPDKKSRSRTPPTIKEIKSIMAQKLDSLSVMHNNPDYWDFSFDEQAAFDFPHTIDHILTITRYPRLGLIGHSAGCAVILMGLAHNSEYGQKVSSCGLFAPAVHLGSDKSLAMSELVDVLNPMLSKRAYPIISNLVDKAATDRISLACSEDKIDDRVCSTLLDGFGGPSNGQNVFLPSIINPMSSHELGQYTQSMIRGFMHYFDFLEPEINLIVYGLREPPPYEFWQVSTTGRMSIWQGNKDALVKVKDTEKLLADLSNNRPAYHLIDGEGLSFNHAAFMDHVNVSILINIPYLKEMFP